MSSRTKIAFFAVLVMLSIAITPAALSTGDGGTFQQARIEGDGSHVEYQASAPDGFFTENRGQFDDALRFAASTPFGHAGVGERSIFLDIAPEGSTTGAVIRYDLVGAGPSTPIGVGLMPHRNNYFFGSDPARTVRIHARETLGSCGFEFGAGDRLVAIGVG
ncbi:MAG: hypothetical protein ACMUHU_07290, partial [Thermoplasmatota archaeon]